VRKERRRANGPFTHRELPVNETTRNAREPTNDYRDLLFARSPEAECERTRLDAAVGRIALLRDPVPALRVVAECAERAELAAAVEELSGVAVPSLDPPAKLCDRARFLLAVARAQLHDLERCAHGLAIALVWLCECSDREGTRHAVAQELMNFGDREGFSAEQLARAAWRAGLRAEGAGAKAARDHVDRAFSADRKKTVALKEAASNDAESSAA